MLIKFGGGVAGASGKSGGTVFARNRTGAYARNWAKPVNPVSPLQAAVRSDLAAAAAAWQERSSAQVDAWNAYAFTMTRLNRLGESYVPTGRQIYTESYLNMRSVGQAPLTTPGPTNISPSLVNPQITAAASTANAFTSLIPKVDSVIIPSGQDPVDCYALVFGAPAHPAQRNNVNKQRRVISQLDGSEIVTGTSIHAAFNVYFGATSPDGQLVDLWIKFVDTWTGLATTPTKVTHVIT